MSLFANKLNFSFSVNRIYCSASLALLQFTHRYPVLNKETPNPYTRKVGADVTCISLPYWAMHQDGWGAECLVWGALGVKYYEICKFKYSTMKGELWQLFLIWNIWTSAWNFTFLRPIRCSEFMNRLCYWFLQRELDGIILLQYPSICRNYRTSRCCRPPAPFQPALPWLATLSSSCSQCIFRCCWFVTPVGHQ